MSPKARSRGPQMSRARASPEPKSRRPQTRDQAKANVGRLLIGALQRRLYNVIVWIAPLTVYSTFEVGS
jgi:hypothetical protein